MNEHHPELAQEPELKVNVNKMGVFVAALAGVCGLLGAWFVLPHRMAAAEAKIAALEVKIEAQSALLIRIDENVKVLKEARRSP